MYLKSLEVTGFKSFADHTRLDFEPGMIAIVGPNGCGKSNVSDAIRWVLGEQRPTALRCGKMHEVVFNGTDSRKPLGMAEVSITFAGCEGVLNTEYDEVTISRRVFRTGEGQYFINKQPARLKDIQRLFMGTGIGTTSYSVMAQGQIDAILSSRPEDRRAVFEEAAGITKFKADRKDALRKIEQTDANLLRLADVIREVKRQIGTLQRQAGKANKYKELRAALRGFDLFLSRRNIRDLDQRLEIVKLAIQDLIQQIAQVQDEVTQSELTSGEIHAKIHAGEERIAVLSEQSAQADGQYARAGEIMRVNLQRIDEYRQWAKRDSDEIQQTQSQIDGLKLQQVSFVEQKRRLEEDLLTATTALEETKEEFDTTQQAIDEARATVQASRQQAMQCERTANDLQNNLAQLEARQRDAILRKERLAIERDQLVATVQAQSKLYQEARGRYQQAQEQVTSATQQLETWLETEESLIDELNVARKQLGQQQSDAAARRAQIDLLAEQESEQSTELAGNKQLLTAPEQLGLDASQLVRPLAEAFDIPKELRLAAEVALRAWVDALIVRTPQDATQIIQALTARGKDSAARFVIAESLPLPARVPCELPRLADRIRCADRDKDLLERLLGNTCLAEQIPETIPDGITVVTPTGVLRSASGFVEIWMPDGQLSSPIARKILVQDSREALERLEAANAELSMRVEHQQTRLEELKQQIASARRELDGLRHTAAQAEGAAQSAEQELNRLSSRLKVVEEEATALSDQTDGDDRQREDIRAQLEELVARRNTLFETAEAKQESLRILETGYNDVSARLTEHRIRVSSMTQQKEHAEAQDELIATRIEELTRTIEGRSRGISSYDESIQRLEDENATLEASLDPLKQESERIHLAIEEARNDRLALARELERAELELSTQRKRFDELRDNRGKAELDQTESNLRRQQILDRIRSDYSLNEAELMAEPDPAWEGGEPLSVPQIQQKVDELNAQIQALGPVNLVAIEEYKQYEERYAFLRAQESDLQESRARIMELIRKINAKTGEMFQNTFEQANANFEKMFTKLFNGGQAKLVLLQNAEDPLECGIDVIARPPGKRPQTISLLSGGERTMTAVSLLFAIFMIKPAPFCLLDELDAALDDSNIGRFVGALKEFLVHSQFLIITHNQYTIAGSDIVYGVTMQEKGVSKILSMRLHDVATAIPMKNSSRAKREDDNEGEEQK